MQRVWQYTLLAACLMLSSQHTQAADMAVAAKVSTLGIGTELTTKISPMVNARFQINGFNYNKTITDTQVSYDASLKLLTVGAIADFYPFSGKFRISGGLYYNGNKFNLNATPTTANTFTFNGTTYTTAQIGSAQGKVDFNSIAPYVGIGWGDAISSGSPFGMSFEIGALYQGKAKTSLTTSRTVAGLNTNIAAEKQKLDDALNKLRFYPVLALGFNWRF